MDGTPTPPNDLSPAFPSSLRTLVWVVPHPHFPQAIARFRTFCGDLAEFHHLPAHLPDRCTTPPPVLDLSNAYLSPAAGEVWRFETAHGTPPFHPRTHAGAWYRPPYTAALRLTRHRQDHPGSEILAEAVLSTRQPYRTLRAQQLQAAGHILRHYLAAGRRPPATPPSLEPPLVTTRLALLRGGIRRVRALAAAALLTDHWQIGVIDAPIAETLTMSRPSVRWLTPRTGAQYYADPQVCPGTSQVLCEEFVFATQRGRLTVLDAAADGTLQPRHVLRDQGSHLSYPYVYAEGDTLYVIPESEAAREINLCRLQPDGTLETIAEFAHGRRFVDTTLFRQDDLYWLAYTDLDLGNNDNLCLAYATELRGPWHEHGLNPVKIDIRSSRPAGTPFRHGDRLFRPAQDCSHRYGAAVVINEIRILSPTDFHEVAISRVGPDPDGPNPAGLHTLCAYGTRTLVDGKHRRFNPWLAYLKIRARLARRHPFSTTSA